MMQRSLVVLGTSALVAGSAVVAQGATLAQYTFDSFSDGLSNPSTPSVVTPSGVIVSNLDRDPGGEGNADALGTLAATQTRHSVLPGNAPVVFANTALAIGIGTTARNPYHATTPTEIVASQDYMSFTVTNASPSLTLSSFSFDYAASVRDTDTTGVMSAAQLFYSINGASFVAVGPMHERIIPSGAGGIFTGFTTSTVDLTGLPTLNDGDSIEFRLAFGDNSGAATGQKAIYIDNLTLDGSVVPEPAALSVLGLAGLGLVRRRRAM